MEIEYFQLNNGKHTFNNIRDAVKGVLKMKCTALNVNFRKAERNDIYSSTAVLFQHNSH